MYPIQTSVSGEGTVYQHVGTAKDQMADQHRFTQAQIDHDTGVPDRANSHGSVAT